MRSSLSLLLILLSGAHAPVNADPEFTTIAPVVSMEAGCPVETRLAAPEDYFPPGSMRRMESGEVLIEFTAEAGVAHPRDVKIVKESGVPDLDAAAIKLGRALAVSTSCGTQRARRIIVFEVWRDPRDQPELRGCLVNLRTTATVLVFPFDEP
jgi:hypothetical protein